MSFYLDNFDMNSEEIKSASIALVVYNANDDTDVHVYLGRMHRAGGEWYFINEERGWKISLNSEQLNRLKPVPDSLKSVLLNADYAVTMVIQSFPGSDMTGYEKTGMKWRD